MLKPVVALVIAYFFDLSSVKSPPKKPFWSLWWG